MSIDPYADSLTRFQADTKGHQMTVLHDGGLYRHLRFAAPDTKFYWYEIVTWPGRLAITGGFGDGYIFARVDDMFEFFRNRAGRINPQYWAEKVVDGRGRTRIYSEDKFRELVTDHVASYGEELPGLRAAVDAQILGVEAEWDVSAEEGARQALRDFEFRAKGPYDPLPFRGFASAWEWDLTDWDWPYLWACHAIVAGIRQYDEHAARQVAAQHKAVA